MDADLVTRLRCWLDEDTPIGVIMNEAAARIAQLEAALEKYDAANRLQHDYANKCRADLARKDKALLAALNDLTERLTISGELPDSVTIAVIRAALGEYRI